MANKRQTCVHMHMPQLRQECSSPVRTSNLVSECGLELRNGWDNAAKETNNVGHLIYFLFIFTNKDHAIV